MHPRSMASEFRLDRDCLFLPAIVISRKLLLSVIEKSPAWWVFEMRIETLCLVVSSIGQSRLQFDVFAAIILNMS